MKLKGSATIELTNVDGSKEVTEQENMITNAPRDLLMARRGEMPPLFKIVSNNESYAKALFGGILLFDDTLNNDPDDYFIPSTKITGYASQDGYGGTDTFRGSYNATESGVQANGSYKFVWDFSTSQANGNIKSLALCPNLMGKIGASEATDSANDLSNSILGSKFNPFNSNGRMLLDSGQTENIENYYFMIVAIHNGIAYAVNGQNICYYINFSSRFIKNNGGVLNLYKFSIGFDKASVKDKVCMANYLGRIDLTLPTDFINDIYSSGSITTHYNYSTGSLIVYKWGFDGSGLKAGAKMNYVEIDLNNGMAITPHEFINNTTVTASAYKYGVFYDMKTCAVYIFSDYVLLQGLKGTVRKLYVLNRSDNSIVKEVKYSDTHEFMFGSEYYLNPIFENGKILVFRTYYQPQAISRWYVLDMETGIVKETNFTNYHSMVTVEMGNKACYAGAGTYLGLSTLVNPFILTTKNNLDSPVVKTASQTMKITYTLSEVEGV